MEKAGVTEFWEIDRIMREAAGFRMGPFELLDLTGLDVSQPVMESIYNQYYQEARYRPSPLAAQRLHPRVGQPEQIVAPVQQRAADHPAGRANQARVSFSSAGSPNVL